MLYSSSTTPGSLSPQARKKMPCAIFSGVLCALLFTLCLYSPFAAKAAEQIRVTYGFDREFPPFSYENPGGQPTGFEVELIQAVFRGTNVVLAYRPLQWDRIGLELSAGTVTLTTGMVQTEQRSKLYLFSQKSTFPLHIKIFTKIYNRFPSIALLRGQPVAVEQGTYQHRLLEHFGGVNIKPYTNRVEGLRALYRDDVAGYCAPVQTTYYYINKLKLGAITTIGTPLGLTEMRVAVNRGRGDVLRLIDEGLARVHASGEYNRLYRKWFVRELSGQEQDIMTQNALTASIPAYAPYSKKGQGATVLTATGKVYSACTVENADPALTLSALRGAVSRAISDGEFELRAAVIVDTQGTVIAPTREELQVLFEFGPGILTLLPGGQEIKETKMVADLLPDPVVKQIGQLQVQ